MSDPAVDLPDFPVSDETRLLERFLTPARIARLREVLANRTRNLVLALEDIYDPHNAAAAIRSAEAMGVQELHVMAFRYPFRPAAAITHGADKWVEVHRHRSLEECFGHLHDRGFLVAAGALVPGARPIHELPFDRPVALVLGNEHEGLSSQLLAAADVLFHLPMVGFTQSFNISVAAALSLWHAVEERRRRLGRSGDLTPDQMATLYAHWVSVSVPMAEQYLRRLRGAADMES